MDRTLALMLVFFGGGLGCLIRYITAPDPSNPFMVANILACLVIGVIYALTRHKVFTNVYIQSFVTVGILGGLSTFTPLATYAIIQAESTFILSFLLFIGYLAVFLAISLVGYIPTALYCQRVMHLQPVPSIVAVVRNRKSYFAKRREEKLKEVSSQQYASMIKELSLAKEMLEKLKSQTEALGELAKRSPQAAREYAKAKTKIIELQKTLQIQQARISQIDPLKGQAPDGLPPAPGFTDAEQSALERKQARQAAQAIVKSKEAEAQAQAEAKVSTENEAKSKAEVTSKGSQEQEKEGEQSSNKEAQNAQVPEKTELKSEQEPKATFSAKAQSKKYTSNNKIEEARATVAMGVKTSSKYQSQDDKGKYPAKPHSKGKSRGKGKRKQQIINKESKASK